MRLTDEAETTKVATDTDSHVVEAAKQTAHLGVPFRHLSGHLNLEEGRY